MKGPPPDSGSAWSQATRAPRSNATARDDIIANGLDQAVAFGTADEMRAIAEALDCGDRATLGRYEERSQFCAVASETNLVAVADGNGLPQQAISTAVAQFRRDEKCSVIIDMAQLPNSSGKKMRKLVPKPKPAPQQPKLQPNSATPPKPPPQPPPKPPPKNQRSGWSGEKPSPKPPPKREPPPDTQAELPQSLEAEQGILGSILVDCQQTHRFDVLAEVSGKIQSWYFFVPAHKTIYEVMLSLWSDGIPIDFITFVQILRDRKVLDAVGGPGYITALFTFVPTAANVQWYINIMREKFVLREIIATGTEFVRRAYEPGADDEGISAALLDEARSKLESIRSLQSGNHRITFRSPSEILAKPRNPSANFLGDRLLGVARSLVIAGIGGIGKSRLVLQLLVALILERVWCSIETHHTKGKRWMLVQTQNSDDRLQDDLAALKKYAGDDWPLVEKNLLIHTLETDRDLMINLSDPKNARELESAIRDYNPIGVAFDPLNEIGIGDLSKDVDMMATCNAISRVSRVGNPERAIVISAHAITGVAGMKKAFGFEAAGFGRGSKVLGFWTRAQINTFPATEDYSVLGLTCGKLNDGKMFSPFAVRLNPAGLYEPEPDFDMDALRDQLDHGKREAPPIEETLRKVLKPLQQYDKAQVAKLIMKDKGISQATAYRWVDKGEKMNVLRYIKKIDCYELT
jgi:hypothetical protein